MCTTTENEKRFIQFGTNFTLLAEAVHITFKKRDVLNIVFFRTKKLLEEASIFPTKCINFGQSQTETDNRLFKMGTHTRFRCFHKAFNIANIKQFFLKNVTTKCFMAQTKLPTHVEAHSTKKSGLQRSCTQFQKSSILCI